MVDDEPSDLKLFKTLLQGGELPPLRDVNIVTSTKFPPIEETDNYDGFIFDANAPGASGTEYAAKVHKRDWRKPIMILTGEVRLLSPDIKLYVNHVCDKTLRTDNRNYSPNDLWNEIRVFIRTIAAIKSYNNII